MTTIDWIVLSGTLLAIIGYGMWKSRKNVDIDSYLKGGNSMKWATIGLSVMATQASAITFLSTPGQAFESGMAFVQNYLGLPIALVIVSAIFIPIYYRLKVFTAYEYLETRFDVKTRGLAAILFLIQRGMGAGITIYAPAIILSKVLDLNLTATILMVGSLVIIYTVSGGTRAVSYTQKYQMLVIFLGMFVAFYILLSKIPEGVSFTESLGIAGAMGKLQAIDFSLDIEKRYTFWSGIVGGLFLALSYFGTDQSQVQRYIGGKNIGESRMGLMFNAVLKIPMQFFILLVGVMVFVFYQFEKPPVFFNNSEIQTVESQETLAEFKEIEAEWDVVHESKKDAVLSYVEAAKSNPELAAVKKEELVSINEKATELREDYRETLLQARPDANVKDSDYVFVTFIINFLPVGVVGLLIAVIFSAAMSSTSGELNALGSTTVIDFYKRFFRKEGTDAHFVRSSRLITMAWGIVAILFALGAQLVENLIEFVNIIGSLFYGTILGIFLVAFFTKKIKSNFIFTIAIFTQLAVIAVHFLNIYGVIKLGYLWYNAFACLLIFIPAIVLDRLTPTRES